MRAQPPQVTTPLALLATAQHGVVSRHQLHALGFSDQTIATLVLNGYLIRLHRGVYAVGHARLTAHGRWMAGVLACGDGALLSHGDALALHDLQRVGAGAVHITAPGPHRHAGIRCHVARDVPSLRATVIDSIPVTGLERAVLDAAPTLSPQRLRSLLEEIERRDRFDRRRFDDTLDAANGHRGTGRLRTALAIMSEVSPDLRSDLEHRFLALIRAAGLPEPSVNVIVAGELFDFSWPRQQLIVEIDSWRYHRSRRSFEDDRRRANVAALAGELLLRITDERIDTAPAAVVGDLAAALSRG